MTKHIGRGGSNVLIAFSEGVTRKVFFEIGGIRHGGKIPCLQKVVDRRAQGRATAQGGEAVWGGLRCVPGLFAWRLGCIALGILLAGELGEGCDAPDDGIDLGSFDKFEISCLLVLGMEILLA